MISLYSGTPGSGKSLHLIIDILEYLRKNKRVLCNFPIKFTPKEIKKGWPERFFYMTNDEITVENLINFAIDNYMIEKGTESQCVVIIDEAGGRFNTRNHSARDRVDWIDLFSQHRKIGFDFILVAQNDRMIDRQILYQIESEFKHRKANNFGPFRFLPFKMFCAIEIWYTAKVRVGANWFMFSKAIASRYDSMKLFSGFKLSDKLLAKIEKRRTGEKIEKIDEPDLKIPIDVIYEKESDSESLPA